MDLGSDDSPWCSMQSLSFMKFSVPHASRAHAQLHAHKLYAALIDPTCVYVPQVHAYDANSYEGSQCAHHLHERHVHVLIYAFRLRRP